MSDAEQTPPPAPKKKRYPALPKFKKRYTRWKIDRSPRRLPRYEPEAHSARARRLAMLGLTNAEIADQFGIPETRLLQWAARHPELDKALQEGAKEADALVAEALFKRATGFINPNAVKIFPGTEKSGPIMVPYTEHYPPDVNAARTWLYNRQQHLWRDRREVEHTGTLEARLRLMTPEQRRARLLELEARRAAIVAAEVTDVEYTDATDDENEPPPGPDR